MSYRGKRRALGVSEKQRQTESTWGKEGQKGVCGWRDGGRTDRKTTADRDSNYETALGKEGGGERCWLTQKAAFIAFYCP